MAEAGRSATSRASVKRLQQNSRPPRSRRKVDPVITEIVRNGVIAVTEEMKTNLMRTAYNIIIYEALDFTTGLFTPAGETISIGIGLPMFIRGMAETVKAKIKHFGADNIRPGDIYVTNDSYLTGSHLNHVTLTLPIFHQGRAGRVLLLHGALARYRRHSRRHEHRHLFGRAADPDPQISGPRRGQSDRGRLHPAECPPAEPRHGRSARAGHRGEDRRAAFPAAHRTLWPRRGARLRSRRSWITPKRWRAAHAQHPGRRLRGGILHGR